MLILKPLASVSRKIVLSLLKTILGWTAAQRSIATPRRLTHLGPTQSRFVVIFSNRLADYFAFDDRTRLKLCKAHSLLIELPPPGSLDDTSQVTIDATPADPDAIWLEAAATTLTARLILLAFRLHTASTPILEVSCRVRLSRRDEALCLEPAAPPQKEERLTSSIALHLAHVFNLAARRQTEHPVQTMPDQPLLSFVVPVYNAAPAHLDDLLRSFLQQTPMYAELVLSDDASTAAATRDWLERHKGIANISVLFNATNAGISGATNAGIAHARGTWISFVDHDDALAPFCVAEIVRALSQAPDCQFLYTDEILTDETLEPQGYFLKPAWDPVLISGVNYINHLSIYRRDRLQTIGGLRSGYDGSQDYDLLLRYTAGLASSQVYHLPYPAYLWRRSDNTFSARFMSKATERARRSLGEHFSRAKPVPVDPAIDPNLHRVRFDQVRTEWPAISVVIPSRDSYELIRSVLDGLYNGTDYPNLEVVVIDNGTTDERTLSLYDTYQKRRGFSVFIEQSAFNFSAAINKGLRYASGDLILILNNDIEITSPGWLKEMASCFDYPKVGVVGSKLLYPSGKIQHVGVIAGLGGLAGHWFIGSDANFPGPMGRLWVRQTLSCVTGACTLISRPCLECVGRFDETNFAIAYNDIDFCLRATDAGFRVVWTPFACLTHHESASRGSDETPENIDRFRREQANLRRLHHTDTLEDRYFSPWYSRMHSDPRYRLRDDLPSMR